MQDKKTFIAKTLHGLEELLANELKTIGAEDVTIQRRMVSFTGNTETLYRANFQTRTATRILMPIYEFKARNEEELYGLAKKFDWTSVMELSHKFAVDATVNSETFTHSHYIALKLKDAVADHFRDRFGRRPFVDPKKPHIQLHIHINNHDCTILLDSSGESLHKRGYKLYQDIAPINEVLAAGLILLSGWDAKTPFIDPMCGSGTIAIEAALIARGIAPGIFRKNFGFENWLNFEKDTFEKVFNDESYERDLTPTIIGNDLSKRAIDLAILNAKNAGMHKFISMEKCSIFDFVPPQGPGTVITNPPYGERLKKEQITTFYKQLGDSFKQKYQDYKVWMLSGNMEAIKSFGLHASKTYTLFNGPLECKYLKYDIYSGSKKMKYKEK
ncbi:MAG TPA: THUMP domain-containing protein [Perlabentimonas sp.]|nr:THUMP domain-containing protein [Perlabentimonas sp.]